MSKINRLIGPFKKGNLSLGENSYIQADSYFITTKDHYITIGDNCAIGHWCYLSTKQHQTENHLERFEGDIVIEDNVWLGNNVVVYPGVTIGHHSVIGHATTITNDIPAYSKVKNVKQIAEFRR